jgi:hypothetical protein
MQDERKTAVFQVRMRPSVKAAGERAAADDQRSLSSLMEKLLIEYLAREGYSLSQPGVREEPRDLEEHARRAADAQARKARSPKVVTRRP